MKYTALVFFLLAAIPAARSQKYTTAAGLRLGTDWGITVKQRIAERLSFEGIAQSSLQREEIILTGLVEAHNPVLGRRLNLYFGGGIHKGWLTANPELGAQPKDPLGITLVGGAEATLGRINLSYDLKPAINIVGGEKSFYAQTGVSVRYVLVKDRKMNPEKKQRQKERHRKQREKEKEKKRRQKEGGGDKWWWPFD